MIPKYRAKSKLWLGRLFALHMATFVWSVTLYGLSSIAKIDPWGQGQDNPKHNQVCRPPQKRKEILYLFCLDQCCTHKALLDPIRTSLITLPNYFLLCCITMVLSLPSFQKQLIFIIDSSYSCRCPVYSSLVCLARSTIEFTCWVSVSCMHFWPFTRKEGRRVLSHLRMSFPEHCIEFLLCWKRKYLREQHFLSGA